MDDFERGKFSKSIVRVLAKNLIVLAGFLLISCNEKRQVDFTPSDSNASQAAAKVLAYLASHSTGDFKGVLVGQNCGHGSQIADPSHMMGYEAGIGELAKKTGKYPAIIGVDYEHDQIFTSAQLSSANAVLIDYWKNGGLVTINWSAQNPWLNDESDIENNPGKWTNTRNQGTNLENVNLADLVNPSSTIYPVWRKKLDRVAAALGELQDAGVVVLWRPLQEMNGFWFWWGTGTTKDGEQYKQIYRDMFNYFTKEKGLHNLLWVYSPNTYNNNPEIMAIKWAYPGDEYVDIVAGTAYNDDITVFDYDTYLSFNKPLAMAELGPDSAGSLAKTSTGSGSFDNRIYGDRIRNRYPAMSYWLSWHNWDNGDGTATYQSIVKNNYANECMNSELVITRDEIDLRAN